MNLQHLLFTTPGSNIWFEIPVILQAIVLAIICYAIAEFGKRYVLAVAFLKRMDARFQEHLKLPIITKHWLQVHSVELYAKARPKFWSLVFSTKPLQDIYWFSENDYNTLFMIPFSHEELKSKKNEQETQNIQS
tara:strand:- start:662 stop:1063 length:402 start_codon:yes stop_codon:yes gene_type:complete